MIKQTPRSPGANTIRAGGNDCPLNVGYRGQTGLVVLTLSLAAVDPTRSYSCRAAREVSLSAASTLAARADLSSGGLPLVSSRCLDALARPDPNDPLTKYAASASVQARIAAL
jgi:hypothetical protein